MKRGDIHWVNLNHSKSAEILQEGSEINKSRPCVIIGVNPINKARKTVIIVPLSSQAKIQSPIVIPINFEGKSGAIVCDQILAVDKSRISSNKVGVIDLKTLVELENSLRIILGI